MYFETDDILLYDTNCMDKVGLRIHYTVYTAYDGCSVVSHAVKYWKYFYPPPEFVTHWY